MKHIRVLYLLALLASMSSCNILRPITTKSSARSIEIEAEVRQMPTVADLVIDSNYVREDTTWTNTYKYIVSKNDMRKVLLGQMLEKAKADVIIQPRENVTTAAFHPFKQTYTMEIYGYPARYRNFRTASEQDLRILNGLEPEPVNYNTIYIGGGYQKGSVVAPAAQEIKPAVLRPVKEKKQPYLRNSYIGTVELGYNWFAISGMHEGGHGLLLNTTHMWKNNNDCVYQGFGAGLNLNVGRYDSDNDAREWLIPVYYTPRFYWGKASCIPYLDLRIGSFLGLMAYNTRNNWNNKTVDLAGGLYYGGFIGMEFGKHFDIAVGTDQFFGGVMDNDIMFNLTVTAKLAVCF